MVEVIDYYGKPFNYDVERFTRPISDGIKGNYTDGDFVYIKEVLSEIFNWDDRQYKWLLQAKPADLYLFDKLTYESRIFSGMAYHVEPKYLSPEEFLVKYDAIESKAFETKGDKTIKESVINGGLTGLIFNVDRFAINYKPSTTKKLFIYATALVVGRTCPNTAELVTHSADLQSQLKNGLDNDINVRYYFNSLFDEIEKRG